MYRVWMILLCILAVFSYWDIKRKALPAGWLCAALIFSTAAVFLRNGWEKGMLVVVGMLPGVLMIVLARVWKEKVGYGDGMVLMIIGNMVGGKDCFVILVVALFLSFLFSCLLLSFFKKTKWYRFPFVPFCFCGALIVYLLGKG